MPEQPSIDPRYDPAFQRGYDGAVVAGGRTDAAGRTASAHAGAAPHVTSALSRPLAGARPATARAEVPERIGLPPEVEVPASVVPAAASADHAVVRVEAPAMRPPWTNPFAIAVVLVGVGALAFGVWLTQEVFRLAGEEQGFTSQGDYVFLQWSMWGGPIFIGIGVLTLTAVLLFCGVYWSRRPAPDDHE
ncbi:MAG: hypothetical protein J0H23_07490 [Micrococcales bacterium]|nr:hypothetical protein [Micrococcales bacterium]OJX67484.1 MAG: hypothetical protein BGO94_01260 [Micrococcales bacterium 72-143]